MSTKPDQIYQDFEKTAAYEFKSFVTLAVKFHLK